MAEVIIGMTADVGMEMFGCWYGCCAGVGI